MTDTKMTRRNFFLPNDIWSSLKARATEKRVTVAFLIREALMAYLAKHE